MSSSIVGMSQENHLKATSALASLFASARCLKRSRSA